MIKKMNEEYRLDCDYACEYILDSEDEVAQLPQCAPSSIAIVVVEGLPIYMVNASGEWVKV